MNIGKETVRIIENEPRPIPAPIFVPKKDTEKVLVPVRVPVKKSMKEK